MPAIAASVALVPFENLSGDPAQDVFARGFVEDIASALSRFGMLEVVYPRALATASAARAGNEPTSMATTQLRGSVRRAADTIRIAVQLLDAQGARQIWAERYLVRRWIPAAPDIHRALTFLSAVSPARLATAAVSYRRAGPDPRLRSG